MTSSPSSPLQTVLLVDANDAHRATSKWFLMSFGYTVEAARTAEEALNLFDPRLHDAVITGNTMPGMTGSEMAHIIKLRSSRTPVIMFTGEPPEDLSCVDSLIQQPEHLLLVKEEVARLLAARAR